MPSNTDDGIVEKMASEFRSGAVIVIPEGDTECRLGILGNLSARELARVAVATYESHLRDKGMGVVPRIPTKEMETKGWHRHMNSSAAWPDVCGEIYRAMLSASPVQSER